MSEYWVSQGKYWCKYCKIYITDDKPSRQHHETGFRHKGNLERYIRDIYKKGIQKEKDKVEEERDIRAIDAAAARAMGQSAEASTSRGSNLAAKKPTVSELSSDPYANYSTAASLGYVDLEAERQAVEQEQREKEGTIGAWTVVSPEQSKTSKTPNTNEVTTSSHKSNAQSNDPEKSNISFSYLKERSLPANDEDYANIEIKVRAPKNIKTTDGVAKAIKQAEKLLLHTGQKNSTAEGGTTMFKPVVAQEPEDETPAEVMERNQAAWDLIAPREEVKPMISPTAEVPLFKKRKVKAEGSSAPSAKRRT